MKAMKVLMGAAVVALSMGMGQARAADEPAEVAAQTGKPVKDRSCLSFQSRALCIAKGARVAGDLRDASGGDEVASGAASERDGAAWYVGAAVGSGSGVFRQAKGVSSSAEVGLFLVRALLSVHSGPPMIGRNLIVGWMPLSMAKDADEASAKGASIVWEATKASFPGSTFTQEAMDSGAVAYRVTGGVCEGRDCMLVPVLKKAGSPELMGGRASASKSPFILGREPSYGFENRTGALYPMTLVVDGSVQTHAYLRQLSRHLPSWLYVAASPETKLDDGTVFNPGRTEPVIYSGGTALLFRFPEPDAGAAVASR